MFSLDIYKLYRSGIWWILVMTVLVSIVLQFMFESNDIYRYLYNPFMENEDISWIYIGGMYTSLFYMILFLPMLVLFFNLYIYQDKISGLLNSLSIFRISKRKYWIRQFMILQFVTLLFTFFFLFLPPLLYQAYHHPGSIAISTFVTGLFLTLKTWVLLLAPTTLVFILSVLLPKVYQGILASLGLLLWVFIFPYSPFAIPSQGINQFIDLSLDKQPLQWTEEHFHWEILSVTWFILYALIFILIVYFFRKKEYFRRLFFLIMCGLQVCHMVSCSSKSSQSGLTNMSLGQQDTALVIWLDTAHVQDLNGDLYLLKSLVNPSGGSLTYLDIWNSYCIPCMKAFPQINQISREYKDKHLKIVYLNTDDGVLRWKRGLDFTNNTGQEGHYRVRNTEFEILQKSGLNVYPRYIILRHDGSVIEFRAPVPNRPFIDSLLATLTD